MRPLKDVSGFIKNSLKTPFFAGVFGLILVVGILFRTYEFKQWLQFSPDQARDAMIISDALKGNAPLPLLGPQAGNTRFKVGPLYYESQYLSARIFGDTPEAMAYPDLLFSILAIPLLFLFLKRYFNANTSLFLMAIMGISYFAIEISRFASNPNSIPFFSLVFLYSLLEIMQKQSWKRMLVWYSLLGLAMGIGIQLHTILVFTMPAVAGLVLVLLWKKREICWKGVALMLAVFFLFNAGQLASEIRSSGANSKALIKSVTSRSNEGGTLFHDLGVVVSCQAESGIYFLSSQEGGRRCGQAISFARILKNLSMSDSHKNLKNSGVAFLGMIFMLGSYFLLWKSFSVEKDRKKRDFLGLISLYDLITLLVLVPVAGEIEMRYFIVLMVVSYVFLGLWIEMCQKNNPKSKWLIVILASLLIFSNILVDGGYFLKYAKKEMNDGDVSILGEIKPMAEYILKNKNSSSNRVVFYGSRIYEKRFYKPLGYLLWKNGVDLQQDEEFDSVGEGEHAFYISAKSSKKNMSENDNLKGLKIEKIEQFQNIFIYKLTR